MIEYDREMVKKLGERKDKDPAARFHYIIDNMDYVDPEQGVEYQG